jgi:uncharacterized protein
MKWQGKRSAGIDDRRGLGAGKLIGGGGIGAVVIALIGYFVFGISPEDTLKVIGSDSGGFQSSQNSNPKAAQDEAGQFVDVVHTSANDIWAEVFAASGDAYRPSGMVLFTQATPTACGQGQAAMGPFYCPADEKVYIDLDFFRVLDEKLGAPGDFAKAYVIGHEVGHHVQKVLGISEQVHARGQSMSEKAANGLSIKLELQADCFAGVWAKRSDRQHKWLEAGDIDEALGAATAVGDDTLQQASTGRVMPDSFTHGTAAQRKFWFTRGYTSADPKSCDTFGS